MSVAASPERVPADPYLLCDFSKSLTLSERPSPLLRNAELSSVERVSSGESSGVRLGFVSRFPSVTLAK